MTTAELATNLAMLTICYAYIIAIIVATGKINGRLPSTLSRKFLHIMIGNVCFFIPFFSYTILPLDFPFFVAAPFILLTFLVSPSSPIKGFNQKMSGLSEVTSGGHKFGLVFYAFSFTVLAVFFSSKPYIIAAGILPMAYGDAVASLVGLKMGRHIFNVVAKKSLEGSLAMFAACFVSLTLASMFFSALYPLSLLNLIVASLGVSAVAVVFEALTPKGLDNLTVPLVSALVFLILIGGI